MTNISERKWRINESIKMKLGSILELMMYWGISKRTAKEYLLVINAQR